VPYLSVFRRVFSHPLRNVYFALRRIRKGRTDYFWEYRYSKKELAQFLHNSEFEEVYTGIDDYVEEDKKRHIGLYADFFFLRSRDGEIWELNRLGRWLLAIGKKISPWAFCSGLHMVVRKKKSVRPA